MQALAHMQMNRRTITRNTDKPNRYY